MGNNPTKSPKTITILDVGTGEGDSCVFLSGGRTSVVSLDCDLEMLKKGVKKKKILRGYVVLADARYLPFKDCSFNMVSSRYLLHCVKTYVECLREMKRLIKPRGHIQIIDICAPVQKVREFLQKCHYEKSPPLACCGILTKNELLHQLNKLGIHVQSIEWSTLKEKESSQKLKNYITKEIRRNPNIKEKLKIRKGKQNFYVHLPVITIMADKK